MGILKDIVKKIALAAAVVAGKRILSKVVTDVIDGDKTTPVNAQTSTPVKPKPANSRKKPTAKPKSADAKTVSTRKPKVAATEDKKTLTKPKAPRKPRAKTADKAVSHSSGTSSKNSDNTKAASTEVKSEPAASENKT
ncbi:hypothetical protein LG201_00060 [Methylobacillus gramineus]|uniref:hypothetical protein n=1 Tax=Methylobacillus gramineus TaxID=755169 RepID=UPI001CFFC5A9|nr:hypothetical protein [Methylobacillus gramineus]MCB5183598.1 hypothetical protein [Methylobacillus gramineus]